MTKQIYPPEFLKLLKSVDAKRPKTVIEHILKYGQITTEELKNTYGYNHPPRAIRDVREQGIPVEMFRVTGSDGRKPESYKHIAMRDIRRLDLLWSGEEVADYEVLIEEAAKVQEDAPEYVKKVLRSTLSHK